MAISEAQKRAVSKYNREHYKQILIRVPFDQKEHWKKLAAKAGFAESLNAFVIKCVEERGAEETPKPQTIPVQARPQMIDESKLMMYQRAATQNGMSLESYVFYALENQNKILLVESDFSDDELHGLGWLASRMKIKDIREYVTNVMREKIKQDINIFRTGIIKYKYPPKSGLKIFTKQ